MKKYFIFLIIISFVFLTVNHHIHAFWGGYSVPKSIQNTISASIGNWCYRHCRIYQPHERYQIGDIVGYMSDDGNIRLVQVIRHVEPWSHIHPRQLSKTGIGVGSSFRKDLVWFRDLTNQFIAYNYYVNGDIVHHNGKMYIFVGDYSRSSYYHCYLDKRYDPTVPNCWGRPGDNSYLYNKVFWKEVVTDLNSHEIRKIWSRHRMYYVGDEVIFPNTKYYYELNGYIYYARIDAMNTVKCTLKYDYGTGVTNIHPNESYFWSCQ